MKNLTKLFLISLFVLFVAQSNAQIKFGPKAGLNISNISTDVEGADPSSIIGFHVGAVVEFSLSDNFVLQPGVLFSSKGSKQKMDGGDLFSSENTIKLNYLEIPINAMYKLDLDPMKILFFAGPYVGYGLNGTLESEETILGEKVSSEEDIEFGSEDGQTNALDFGFNLGAGVEISNLQITAQYGLGLANMDNGDDVTMNNRVIGISVAYMFGK